MTLTNRELFYRDPTGTKIPNDGVARVVRPETDQQWDVLRWELQSFVCDGQYARGLERILDSFLTNLSQSQQPAVWVSGFYGSGKSHLARVLEHLWNDLQLPTGERARDLVTLPDDVRDHLAELSTAGKRLGGLWSAAGTLSAGRGDAVRLAFLSVLFESAGLPVQFPLARFVIWARDNDYLDAVRAAVEAAGKVFDKELSDLYVSPIIAKALLESDPSLADSVKGVRELLRDQFPPKAQDITDDQMFEVVADVLRLQSTTPERNPLTLVVLDEMQQYIGDDHAKALAVQNIVEGCTARFESQMLFVATGQSALTATATLQKLTDRFAVQVALSDKDVETVVREVVLRKRPEHVSALTSTLDAVSGEIDKHLAGTQLGPKAADKADLVPDYPLLPTRRRFWEVALRAIDHAGKAGMLRSQLRLVHDAAKRMAGAPAGHVVGADFLYEEQAAGMLQSGVLLKEIDELIETMRAEGGDGELRARICSLVFLISQIPAKAVGGDTGLRATAPFLADLLVEDLASDGAPLRKRVPELLNELVVEGRLMKIDDEYRLQTEEGAEWEKAYRSRLAAISDDTVRLEQLRTERLKGLVERTLASVKPVMGASKNPHKLHIHWGQDEPTTDAGDVPVWIRDEWSESEASARKAAAQVGDESPVIFVLLPKRDAAAIKEALASHAAAEETLHRPTPQTDEGRAAARAMTTRRDSDDERLRTLFKNVVANARVLQGGGAEVTVSSLDAAVRTAADRSLIRMFSKFAVADHKDWPKVVTKAREGAPDALEAIGYSGEAAAHPVCKQVLGLVSPGGTDGAAVQKHFADSPFGWPKDAVNGALLVLLASGNLRAEQDHKDLASPADVVPNQIGKVTFYKEDDPPTTSQRLAVKGLLKDAEVTFEDGQEGSQIPALLQKLKDFADRCGGAPPLPAPPDVSHLDELATLTGNQRFRAVADEFAQLSEWLGQWRNTARQRQKREQVWSELQRLLGHAAGLSISDEVTPAVTAIRDGRQLLDEPDPVTPIMSKLTAELRTEVQRRAEELDAAKKLAVEELEAWDDWAELAADTQRKIIAEANLEPEQAPDLTSTDRLLGALDHAPLRTWGERIALVPARRDQARQRAAK